MYVSWPIFLCTLQQLVIFLIHLSDKESADQLTKTVDEAVTLLNDYNSRLSAELLERKRVGMMLRNFIVAQKESLAEDEMKLQVRDNHVHVK